MRSRLLPLLLAACSPAPDDSAAPCPRDTGEPPPVPMTVELDTEQGDECVAICGKITAPGSARAAWSAESSRDGFLITGRALDELGRAAFCLPTPLSPGEHTLAIAVEGEETALLPLQVRSFGEAFGLPPSEPLAALPWFPEVVGRDDPPLLSPVPDGWERYSVMMPSTVRFGGTRFLYYAGSETDVFHLGVAYREADDQPFSRYEGNPILTPEETGAVDGDWNFYAQNTPEALVVGDAVWLYYNGRAAAEGGQLSIGLAISEDGLRFEDHPSSPVFSPTGVPGDFDEASVAHPSVLVRDGVFHLWYASGTLEIGLALSTDGVSWERYCGNPVLSGRASSWDEGHVKAPEVVWDGARYLMTYSGCGQGCYQVGWAASADGTHWIAADEPVISPTAPPTWNSYGTQAAFIEPIDGGLRFWYAGTGDGHGAIGTVEALTP